jgi:hypothetical protein
MARLLGALVALVTVTGCASSAPSARAPEDAPYVSSPLVPLPPPSPLAALAASAQTVVNQVAELPCPPPGMPAELASKLDCAAMRRFAEATVFIPREISMGTLPPAVDLRAHGLVGPVKNQQQVGACAGFAMSTVLDNAARRFGRGDVVSPLHVFATYAPTNDDMSRALKGRAFTVEPVWPYEPGRACRFAQEYMGTSCRNEYGVVPGTAANDPGVLAERERADASGRLRILGYEELGPDPDQIALVLASGEALWAAFNFEDGAWNQLHDGSDRLPHYPANENVGHAVVLEGYRSTPNGREFLFQNSWGTGWGRGGYAWISETMVRTHLRYAYRVVASDASVPPPSSSPGAPAWGSLFPQLPTGWPAMPALPGGAMSPAQVIDTWWPPTVGRPF